MAGIMEIFSSAIYTLSYAAMLIYLGLTLYFLYSRRALVKTAIRRWWESAEWVLTCRRQLALLRLTFRHGIPARTIVTRPPRVPMSDRLVAGFCREQELSMIREWLREKGGR